MSVLLLFLATVLVARIASATVLRRATLVAAHRATLLIVGGLTAARVAQTWGSWNAPAVYHDEKAYVLQANIFAGLRWSAPTPPVPEAFEQPHVLVEPRYASKYFPGHSLVLAPFAFFGVPGLAVVIMSGITGMLVLLIGRHVAGPSVALLAWALWLSSPEHLTWRAMYFSQTTSSCCVLLAAFGVLQWRKTNANRWLLAVAGALGWCAITRPLTAAIIAIPIGAAVVWHGRSRHSFAGLGRAFMLGSAIVALLPLWAWRTTGSPVRTPYAEWTAQYLPFDVMGFAAAAPDPQRAMPPELQKLYDDYRAQRLAYTPDRYWPAIQQRGRSLIRISMAWQFAKFAPLALLGLAVGGGFMWVAALAWVLHLLAHGFYYHDISWMIYYMEYFPLIPLLVATGAGWLFAKCVRAGHPWAGSADGSDPSATFAFAATLAVWMLAIPPARSENDWVQRAAEFRARVSRLSGETKIVFVRPSARTNHHFVLVANEYPPDRSATWVVRDVGPERDDLLRRSAPLRVAWLYDEETKRFSLLPAARVAARTR